MGQLGASRHGVPIRVCSLSIPERLHVRPSIRGLSSVAATCIRKCIIASDSQCSPGEMTSSVAPLAQPVYACVCVCVTVCVCVCVSPEHTLRAGLLLLVDVYGLALEDGQQRLRALEDLQVGGLGLSDDLVVLVAGGRLCSGEERTSGGGRGEG